MVLGSGPFESNIAASLRLAEPSVRWRQGSPECTDALGVSRTSVWRFAGEAALPAAAIACFASVWLKDT